jgi:hypothetical protein
MKQRIGAIIVLVIVVLILGHSIVCFFQGKFAQAMTLFPLLLVGYVFGVARGRKPESWEQERQRNDPEDE